MAVAVIQRPLRGSRVSTFYPVKTLPLLSSLDSAFQLQEYISLLIRYNVHDVERIVALPGKPSGKDKEKENEESAEEKDLEKAKGDVTVDEACWIYEQLRRLAQDLTHPLITMLQQECSRTSCPEMKAGEWLYLCVAHGTDGAMEQCCAIDYILHTLDSATALLNSPRAFPSRLQIPPASHRHFSSLARRLGRIFAHAYFHHRDIFAQAEAESSLYARFLALTTRYDLVPPDFMVIPPTKVITDSEGDENDIPRHPIDKPPVIVPDPSEVQPPRLLAASLDPQAERDKEKVLNVQHSSSILPTSTYNPTSVRMISRVPTNTITTKTRNPPGLFVSNGGLIPLSAGATAAPTTAVSLFASSEAHLSSAALSTSSNNTPAETGVPSVGAVPGLAPGQESPRKAGRPRTDTMVYSEGYGNGRGNSPIPIVRLGARLNEPGENKDHADAEDKVIVDPVHSPPQESEPYVVEEKREVVEPEADFVPIDDEMAVVGVVDEQEGNVKVEESVPQVGNEQKFHETAIVPSGPDAESEPAKVEAEGSGVQSSSLGQEKEEQSLGEPEASQPQPQTETILVESTTSEAAEAEENAQHVNGAAEEPEHGQDAEKELAVESSSMEAKETQNGENSNPEADDKEEASEKSDEPIEADSASSS
ncbi:hypothetical protein F5887DRAFT_1235905 [Amanita rubescens]|nr:hypothetical protein F5887DRAFT_1235905 [Amanita rubescens]